MEYKDLKQIVKSEMDKNKWKRINFISMCKLFLASQEHERQDQEQEDMEYSKIISLILVYSIELILF